MRIKTYLLGTKYLPQDYALTGFNAFFSWDGRHYGADYRRSWERHFDSTSHEPP